MPQGTLRVGMTALTTVTTQYNTGAGGGSGQSAQLYWPAFDGLTWVDREGVLKPGLAREWSTPDGTTWTFTLRDDVKFHNGNALTSADVVSTFDYYRNPENRQQAVALFGNVANIEAPTPNTVRFTLRNPSPSFAKTIALGFVVQGAELQRLGPEEYFKPGVAQGTGAYRFSAQTPRESVSFEAMPADWVTPRGPAAVQTLVFLDLPEPAPRLAATRSGQSDVAYTITFDQIAEAQGGNLTTKTYLGSAQNHLVMNVTEEPFNNRDIRLALNHAINRQAIIDGVFKGTGAIDTQMIGPAVVGYNPDLQPYAYDPARARQLLASGGRPNGFTTEIYYTLVTPTQGPDSAAAIASDLAQIGVRAELRLLQSADWLQQYFGPPDSRKGLWAGTTNWEQTFEAESVWRWWSDEVAVGTATSQGGRRWENPVFFDLYRTAKATLDERERNTRYQAAGRYLYEQVPVVFLWAGGAAVAYNGNKLEWTPGLFADIWAPEQLQFKGGN